MNRNRRMLLIAGLALILLTAISFSLWGVSASPPSFPEAGVKGQGTEGEHPPSPRLSDHTLAPVADLEKQRPADAPLMPKVSTGFLPAPDMLPPPISRDHHTAEADAGTRHPITREGIKTAMGELKPDIRECYEAWLQQNPTLEGRLVVKFKISQPAGKEVGVVDDVSIERGADGGLSHMALEGCVLNAVQTMRFDVPPGGSIAVTYPFQFAVQGPDEDDSGVP